MSASIDPLGEIGRLFDRVGRQFEAASRRWEAGELVGPVIAGTRPMPIDVLDRTEEYLVHVDLPGVDREDVDIRVTDRRLRVKTTHENDEDGEDGEDGEYVRRERKHDTVSRSVRLPESVDEDGVTATLESGVLRVTLPKAKSETAYHITVT